MRLLGFILVGDKTGAASAIGEAGVTALWVIGYEDEPPYGYSHSDLNRGF